MVRSAVRRVSNHEARIAAPILRDAAFRPLLKNQRAQGLLGAHLGSLRKLGLVSESTFALVGDAPTLVAGAGSGHAHAGVLGTEARGRTQEARGPKLSRAPRA